MLGFCPLIRIRYFIFNRNFRLIQIQEYLTEPNPSLLHRNRYRYLLEKKLKKGTLLKYLNNFRKTVPNKNADSSILMLG